MAAINLLESNISNEDFNVAPGKMISVKELAYKIIELMSIDTEPIFLEREVFVSKRQANNYKLKSSINFEFQSDIDQGLSELIDHVRNNISLY